MKLSQVAVQLYTCRDTLQTASGVAATLARLRKIGYTAVQASGLGPIPTAELSRILADTGMVCCSTHEPANDILSSPAKVIDRLRALPCKMTAYPFPHGIDFSSQKAVNQWIGNLRRSAEVLAQAGLDLCYHNHNHEFRKLGGRVILDLIYEGAPAILAEADTYWIQYGGGEPVAWCRKLAGRLRTLHLKDFQTTPENKPLWCEIGEGVLDFKTIIAAAGQSGCQWFIVEQDTCPGDPVESLAASYRYLSEHLVSD